MRDTVCVSLLAVCWKRKPATLIPHHQTVGRSRRLKWGGQVSDRETIHCALKALDWGYPLNNCSPCLNRFKVFRHTSGHASYSSVSFAGGPKWRTIAFISAKINLHVSVLECRSPGFLSCDNAEDRLSPALSQQLNRCCYVRMLSWHKRQLSLKNLPKTA